MLQQGGYRQKVPSFTPNSFVKVNCKTSVAKKLFYINNAFNGYRYLKSTRKELSHGTLMLKKNIVQIGGIAIEIHTLSKKNIPPPVKMTKVHQNVQNGY